MKESLYKQMARELALAITQGKYPRGSLFPTEMELCESWQVSRHTVREALRELAEQGLSAGEKAQGHASANRSRKCRIIPPASLEDLLVLAKNNLRVVKRPMRWWRTSNCRR